MNHLAALDHMFDFTTVSIKCDHSGTAFILITIRSGEEPNQTDR